MFSRCAPAEDVTLTLSDVTFRNNAGDTGGAYISNSTATITATTFTGNTATDDGRGGIAGRRHSHSILEPLSTANDDLMLCEVHIVLGRGSDVEVHGGVGGRLQSPKPPCLSGGACCGKRM